MMDLQKRIEELTNLTGISSREGTVLSYLQKTLEALGIASNVDITGNLRARVSSYQADAKTILLEAHMDRIGFMVSGIDGDGRLQFVPVGGVDERILSGLEVIVETDKTYFGIIVPANDEKKREYKDYRIDIGLTEDDAKKQIPVGSAVSIRCETKRMFGDKLSGAGLDNRAGIAAILDCVSRIQKGKLPYHLELLFSQGEEIGLQGAYMASVSADAAIVVDVTHGETFDTKGQTGVFPLGSGAVICRGPNLHYAYTNSLINLAKEKKISYEIEVASASSGTNAWALQIQENGIPCMLVSIPLRYMHTNLEMISLHDVQTTADLLYFAVMGGIDLA